MNILGLTLGLTVFLVLAVIVQHELSYDRIHDEGESVYRIVQSRILDGSEEHLATTPLVLTEDLPAHLPQVESATRLLRESGGVIRVDGEVSMLNVHMKSGCFVDGYSSRESEACEIFSRQVPVLNVWVEEQERLERPYIVLGDFSHRRSAPYNRLTRLLTDNSDGSNPDLVNRTAQLIGCHPYYPAPPIDHILTGHLTDSALAVTPRVHAFADMDPDRMLSDHCAVTLRIKRIQLPLSSSMTWHTTSKEYRFLTRSIHLRAADMLADRVSGHDLPASPRVVEMDVDETVLDNGAYQIGLDRTGRSFSPSTLRIGWRANRPPWFRASIRSSTPSCNSVWPLHRRTRVSWADRRKTFHRLTARPS